MSVPNNPVRIYHSGNIGAQKIEGGSLDFLNVLKQIVGGELAPFQSLAVQISGTKAIITCTEAHNLYPYQVVKLTNTGTALEGKEFFVLNDENLTSVKFAIDLGEDATAMPNVITITIPTLGWSIVEDSAEWLSFRPSSDARIPLWRLSKTANNPTTGQRRVYSGYLARDVNMDGSLIKNYTHEQFFTSSGTTQWDQVQGTAWMIIADKQFMYFTVNRPIRTYYGNPDYSFNSGNRNNWNFNPAICWTYGVPTLLLEDLPLEWATILNGVDNWIITDPNGYSGDNYRRGCLNLTGAEFMAVTARNPYDFQGNVGWVQAHVNWQSGRNGYAYPNIGTYGVICAKNPIAIRGKGVFANMRGCRSYLSEIVYLLRDSRTQTPYNDHVVKPNSYHMGLFEANPTKGKQALVNIQASADNQIGYYENRGCMQGIRVGCSWDTADAED